MKENSASLASLIWTVMNLGAGGGGGIGTVLEKRTTRKINKMHKEF